MTRTQLAQEFIVEMESVLDNMKPLDIEKAKDRVFFKALLKKLYKSKLSQKRANKEGRSRCPQRRQNEQDS